MMRCCGILLGLFALVHMASGTTYYVSVTGNDTHDGSSSSPFLTLERALSAGSQTTPLSIIMGPGEFVTAGEIDLTNRSMLTITGSGARPCVATRYGSPIRYDYQLAISMNGWGEPYEEPMTCYPASSTYISGESDQTGHRLFSTSVTASQLSANLNLTLSNLVLYKGHAHASDPYGGCLNLLGDDIHVRTQNVIFQNCQASGSQPGYPWGGENNGQKGEGGAIYTMGCKNTFMFEGTSFYSNFVGGNDARGGGINFAQSDFRVSHYAAFSNSAGTCTGANTMSFVGGNMMFNLAGIPTGLDTYGGFMYSINLAMPYWQNISMTGVTMDQNAAYRGSAVKLRGLSPCLFSLTDSSVSKHGFDVVFPGFTTSLEGTISYDMDSPNPGCRLVDGAGCSTPNYQFGTVGFGNSWTIVVIQRNTFAGNKATQGGALWLASQHIADVVGNTFTENIADFGGAILGSNKLPLFVRYHCVLPYCSCDTTTNDWCGGGTMNQLKENMFISNTANTAGGAINAAANSLWRWVSNNFTTNQAGRAGVTGFGGAADIASYSLSELFTYDDQNPWWRTFTHDTLPPRYFWHHMYNNSFIDNVAGGSLGLSGGVRFTQSSNLPIGYSYFSGNQGSLGLGASMAPSCWVTIENSTFENHASPLSSILFSQGGAVWTLQTSTSTSRQHELTVTNTVFKNNTVGATGGAVSIENGAHISFTNCVFDGNKVHASGGAIYSLKTLVALSTTNCVFRNNLAQGTGGNEQGGGAINLAPGAEYVDTNSNFSSNNASVAWGGAILGLEESKVTLTGTVLSNNAAIGRPGGAIAVATGSTTSILHATFEGNKVIRQTAAAYLDPAIPASCAATAPNAEEGGSGAHIYANWVELPVGCDGSPPSVTYTTVLVNETSFSGASSVSGGVFCDACDLKVDRSTVSGNVASQFGGGFYISKAQNTKFEFSNSVCEGNAAEIGGCIFYENRTLSETKGESVDDTGWSQATAFPGVSFTDNVAHGYGHDYASDINEAVPIYQVTYRSNITADMPPGTVPPYDDLADPIYVVATPQNNRLVRSLLNKATNLSYYTEFRPGVFFNSYIQLRDHFTQIATSDLTGSGVIVQLIPDTTRQPGIKSTGVSNQGITNISRVEFGGSAQESYNEYNWTVESTWFRLTNGKVQKEEYDFTYNSTATECVIGEKTTYDQDPVLIARAETYGYDDYLSQKVIKSCTWCKAGSYAVETPTEECKDCPTKGADCAEGGSYIKPKGNYWRHYAPTDNIYKCPYDNACLGVKSGETDEYNVAAATVPTPCKDGYEGPLCAVCSDEFANTGSQCIACGGIRITTQFVLFMLGMLIVIGVLGYYVYDKFKGDGEKEVKSTQALKILMKKKKTLARLIAISGQIKVLIAYFQVVIAIILSGSATYPTDFTQLMDSFEIVNIDVIAMFRSMCIGSYSYYAVFLWNLLMPVCVILILMGYTFLTRPSPDDDSHEAAVHSSFCWKSSLMLLFCIYPNTSRVMLGMFNCHAIKWDDDTTKYFMRNDYSIECFEGDWWYYMPWATVGVFLYPLGVPFLFWFILAPYASNAAADNGGPTFDDSVVKEKFDFLFARFVPDYWWYETSELVRKCLIGCMIPMFVEPGTATNTLVLLCVNLVYICMMMITWPFKGNDDNYLMALSLVAIQVTLFGTLIINGQIDTQDHYGNGVTTGILLGSSITLIVLYLVMLLRFQLPFICNHGLSLCGLDCIAKSRLNCFRPKKATPAGDVVSVPLVMGDGFKKTDLGVGVTMNPLAGGDMQMDEDELDELIETYFHRYDLDESHTVNSFDELQQLTTNLAFKLKLPITGDEVDEIISSVGRLDEENGMSLEVFNAWFKDNFLEFEESDEEDRGGMAGSLMTAISMNQNADMNIDMMENNYDDGDDDGDGD